MDKILFINACVRENSRTLILTKEVLKKLNGEIREVNLEKEAIRPLNGKRLKKRDRLIENGELGNRMFRFAKDFAEADKIVIAAPFWDLSFPSLVKIYFEAIMVAGITFKYTSGKPEGLCRAKSLKYITTSGGPVFEDFGYTYVKSLSENFFGIEDVSCCRAENLDAECILPEEFLEKAKICEIR